MGTFRFELNNYRKDKDGKTPIRLIYSVNSNRKVLQTGIVIYAETWDQAEQEAIYLTKKQAAKKLPLIPFTDLPLSHEVDTINDKLDGIVQAIKNIEQRFKLDKITFSADMVVKQYKETLIPETKKDQSHELVPLYIDKYVGEQRNILAPGSLKVYENVKHHLAGYEKYANCKVRFTEMDRSFFLNFQNYLIEQVDLRNTTAAKVLSKLKTILNYAAKYRVEVNNDYRNFTIRKENLGVIALSKKELDQIVNFNLSDKGKMVQGKEYKGKPISVSYATLDRARQIFVMGCATGMRYSDLTGLRWENILEDEIQITVKKTKETLMIPLNAYSATILKLNVGKIKPLPTLTNQRLNDYVKLLAKEVGINTPVSVVRYKGSKRVEETKPKYQLISAHTGRKTFVTASLEMGMSAEETMSITGHADYKSFKKYLHITNKVKKAAMSKAWGKTAQLKAV
ncbi:MAG TPA: site-specific integrase [Niabella sp.]|nr:site-specific integrase [Niabella sp.]